MLHHVVLVVMLGCRDRAPAQVAVATEPWALVAYAGGAHPGAVMSLGVRLAFVSSDGAVRWRAAVASTRERESLEIVGDALVAFDGGSARVLDLATGGERWHRRFAAPIERVTYGDRSVAVETQTELEVVGLATGAALYHAHRPARWTDGDKDEFLLADDDAVWAIDGATGRERWRQAIAKPGWVRRTPTTVIVHAADDVWWELELGSGRVVGHGVLREPAGRVEHIFGDNLGDRFERIADPRGGSSMACIDPRGVQRWRVPIEEDTLRIAHQVTDEASGRVALLDQFRKPVFLVDLHGTVHAPRLAERFVGFSGPCALVERSGLILDCIEVATGLRLWAAGLREGATVCPAVGGGALLVEGGLVTRLDGNGRVRWRVDLPGDARLGGDCASADAVVFTSGSDERDDHAVHVLDVTTGKLSAVAL